MSNTGFLPCSTCGSSRKVPTVYGMPGPELWAAAERGEVILGGCCPDLDWMPPKYLCKPGCPGWTSPLQVLPHEPVTPQ